jgi:hypothetical protein
MCECLSWAALLCHDALDELKIHHSERAIAYGRWSPVDEFLAGLEAITMLPALNPT